MSDKQQFATPQAKEPNLTELAGRHKELSASLAAYTAARNYLWGIATGQASLPVLTVAPLPGDASPDPTQTAAVDMNKLSHEAIETILVMMIEHEERLAFATWQEIANVAAQACGIINKVQNVRDNMVRKQPQQQEQTSEEPQIIQMPQRGKVNDETESQDRPDFRPGE
jgi:hypothetical protein